MTSRPQEPQLSEEAQSLYHWALINDPVTAQARARAADETDLGEDACTAAFATLTGAGLLKEVRTARGTVWEAQSPQAAGAQHLAEREAALRTREDDLRGQEDDLRRERERLRGLREQYAALMPVYLHGRQLSHPHGMIDLLTDKIAVRAMLVEAVDAAREEVLVSKPGGAFPPAALREALPRDLALLASGLRMRNLYQHATRYDQPTRAHAEQLIAAGAEIRTLTEVLPQMIVIDRELAFLPAPGSGALVIREPSLLAFLIAAFERDWGNAAPFSVGPQAAHDVSEDLKQTIVQQLSNGLKDEAIARRLGVSLRTCRRHVSELLETLGATSRFRAGVITERLRAAMAARTEEAGPPAHAAAEAGPESEPGAGPGAGPGAQRCEQCGGALPAAAATGRRRRHCSPRCRSRAHRARQRPADPPRT
ncbi:helix-turn-helix domain-containing protein [Streptomyces rubellomurinus]|uniref:helix-turn-helix domain-containing protein n=1 Tax=Streptomyces rubellomurinus (strain ATCC 31215) TaxID=359131 RepID=UPI000695A9FE|nr:LuxR C-terminal-related transcriptional regulator [Streptomyces rubellomurinus]